MLRTGETEAAAPAPARCAPGAGPISPPFPPRRAPHTFLPGACPTPKCLFCPFWEVSPLEGGAAGEDQAPGEGDLDFQGCVAGLRASPRGPVVCIGGHGVQGGRGRRLAGTQTPGSRERSGVAQQQLRAFSVLAGDTVGTWAPSARRGRRKMPGSVQGPPACTHSKPHPELDVPQLLGDPQRLAWRPSLPPVHASTLINSGAPESALFPPAWVCGCPPTFSSPATVVIADILKIRRE